MTVHKGKRIFKKLLNKIFIVLIILLIIFLIKKLNTSFTNKVLRIIDRGINYEFDIKQDGKKALVQAKKIVKFPQKIISKFNLKNKKTAIFFP